MDELIQELQWSPKAAAITISGTMEKTEASRDVCNPDVCIMDRAEPNHS